MNKKQSVALSSVFASIALTVLKLVVGLTTGSMGILSEAAHSFLDFGAALLTFFAVRVGDKEADESHHFGHEKIESVSALIETGLLFLTSAWIIYEAVKRLSTGKVEIEVTWYAFAVMAFSIIVDYSRSRALKKVAKETKSQALEADALHFSSDILSSLTVIAGLIFVWLGIAKADAIAAIGVSLFVLRVGYSLGKRTIDVLVDTVPSGLSERIIDLVQLVEGVIAIKRIRVRPAGITIFIDITITVSAKLSITKAHAISDKIENKIKNSIPEADITIHLEPHRF
ncbi:MAG: cation diffusion facilitator family transporter [Candidatus Daviesbacteria bacterium]|nr:cation diffusion facilitator family transporter [Candidatus Daviesbacteria bacterium]